MIQDEIHRKIVDNCGKVEEWVRTKTQNLCVPIYSSYDLRDSGCKTVNVDGNVFPAGFNNICPADKDSAVERVGNYLSKQYGSRVQKILLLTEEHTNNPFYWENVHTLASLIEQTGRVVKVAIAKPFTEPVRMQSSAGKEILVHSAKRVGDGVQVENFVPDLIVSNNDFSDPYEEWATGLKTPMDPPRELGWYRRKKDIYFQYYNQLAAEFSDVIGLDPWHLQVKTKKVSNFQVSEEQSAQALADVVDQMIEELTNEYRQRQIEQKPFVFVKNNSGTYGLAVIQVNSGQEVRQWNYKARKKMKAAKGGREVDELIVQEGVPSATRGPSGEMAEPVIYMIGFELAGGFLRTHTEKGPMDSLNSPGAVYQRLCISDWDVNISRCPMENVYGCVARIGALAVGMEAREICTK